MSEPPRKMYMVVMILPEADGRQTGRLDRTAQATKELQDGIVTFLDGEGIARSEYNMQSPTVVGTFGVRASEAAVKAIRRAPSVEAVLETSGRV